MAKFIKLEFVAVLIETVQQVLVSLAIPLID